MSDDIAIKVQNLTKTYKLYDSPQDRLKESLHPLRKKYHKDFYALNDVSFEIKKGETVGIVGRNGSGKSTLLKLITGVLTPSNGNITVHGKISALLELGTGFNPQLTGIENVYFNGTLLGFSKEEMDRKLDAILAFADIGDFIHQPVKTYSSGMFIRLAFAVAVHIEPEILIVDEALSVGDEAFQRKCFARLIDFQKQGHTILFVSHSASVIIELCNKALLFDDGELLLEGQAKPIVTKYQKLIYTPKDKISDFKIELRSTRLISNQNQHTAKSVNDIFDQDKYLTSIIDFDKDEPTSFFDNNLIPKSTETYESQGAIISNPFIYAINGQPVNVLTRGIDYIYRYDVMFDKDSFNVRFGMFIKTTNGYLLGGLSSHTQTNAIDFVPAGTIIRPIFRFKCLLAPGVYFLNSGVAGNINGDIVFLHRIIDIAMFRVKTEIDTLTNGIIDFSSKYAYDNTYEIIGQ